MKEEAPILDSDNDGVLDGVLDGVDDECPKTTAGVDVTPVGCPRMMAAMASLTTKINALIQPTSAQ